MTHCHYELGLSAVPSQIPNALKRKFRSWVISLIISATLAGVGWSPFQSASSCEKQGHHFFMWFWFPTCWLVEKISGSILQNQMT
jgi:hypothetical protein